MLLLMHVDELTDRFFNWKVIRDEMGNFQSFTLEGFSPFYLHDGQNIFDILSRTNILFINSSLIPTKIKKISVGEWCLYDARHLFCKNWEFLLSNGSQRRFFWRTDKAQWHRSSSEIWKKLKWNEDLSQTLLYSQSFLNCREKPAACMHPLWSKI